jgi:hypothetical protein
MTSAGFAVIIGAALAVLVSPGAMAQDFGAAASDSLSTAGSHAGTVSVNAHLQRNGRKVARSTREQRIACAGKARFAKEHGTGDARVRRLYRLCDGLGL